MKVKEQNLELLQSFQEQYEEEINISEETGLLKSSIQLESKTFEEGTSVSKNIFSGYGYDDESIPIPIHTDLTSKNIKQTNNKLLDRYNIMVLKPGIRLGDYLNAKQNSPEFKTTLKSAISHLEIASKLTERVLELHNKNIIHRDINFENILIHEETSELSLIDLGLARRLQPGHNGLLSNIAVGNETFCAPEANTCITVHQNNFYFSNSKLSDVYSLGVILTGTLEELLYHLPELPECQKIKKQTETLIDRMLSTISTRRPSTEEVLKTLLEIQLQILNNKKEIESEFQRWNKSEPKDSVEDIPKPILHKYKTMDNIGTGAGSVASPDVSMVPDASVGPNTGVSLDPDAGAGANRPGVKS